MTSVIRVNGLALDVSKLAKPCSSALQFVWDRASRGSLFNQQMSSNNRPAFKSKTFFPA